MNASVLQILFELKNVIHFTLANPSRWLDGLA